MDSVSVGLICTILGAIFGYVGFLRTTKKDTAEETSRIVKIDVKLDNISKNVDEIRLENKDISKTVTKLGERVTIVEQKVNNAHQRIDDIEKR